MMKLKKIIAVLGLGLASISQANFEAGVAAFDRFDYVTAREAWLPLAQAGDRKAQYNLGLMLEQGYGQPADATKALGWYKKAAQAGYAEAQYRTGNAYYFGKGTNKDLHKARDWWQQAASQAHKGAQYNLGVLHLYGGGEYYDAAKAKHWLAQASKQGHVGAGNMLATFDAEQKTAAPAGKPKVPAAKPTSAQKVVKEAASKAVEKTKPKNTEAKQAAKAAPKRETTPAKAQDWIAEQAATHYTIQLIVLGNRTQAEAFIRRHGLQNKAYAYQLKGSQMSKVIYGSYASKAKATAAIQTLPEVLRKDGPWPKKFALVQAERG